MREVASDYVIVRRPHEDGTLTHQRYHHQLRVKARLTVQPL